MTGRDTYDNGIQNPSSRLADLISGKLAVADADEATLSWLRHYVYERADLIMGQVGSDARRAALAKEPEHLRGMIEAEFRRLFEIRKGKT